MQCKKCSRAQKIGGSAMTIWKCLICNEEHMSGNTCHPKLCSECSKKHSLCGYCLTKIKRDN